jgi:hypothetical protein
MRTSPYGNNPRIISWVLSCFIEKKYFLVERSQIGVLCRLILAFWVVGSLNPGLI